VDSISSARSVTYATRLLEFFHPQKGDSLEIDIPPKRTCLGRPQISHSSVVTGDVTTATSLTAPRSLYTDDEIAHLFQKLKSHMPPHRLPGYYGGTRSLILCQSTQELQDLLATLNLSISNLDGKIGHLHHHWQHPNWYSKTECPNDILLQGGNGRISWFLQKPHSQQYKTPLGQYSYLFPYANYKLATAHGWSMLCIFIPRLWPCNGR